jgi:proteic killer suppression protein
MSRLETEAGFDGGYPPEAVSAYRKRMQQIRAALDERAFYALKSLRFKRLQGNRAHQRSMRLNDQWRLILEFEDGDETEGKRVVVVGIEDYH